MSALHFSANLNFVYYVALLRNKSRRRWRIAAQAELIDADVSVCALHNPPIAVSINGNVRFTVAVIIARCRNVGWQAKLQRAKTSVTALQDIPNSCAWSKNRSIVFAVAVKIESRAVCR